MYLTTKMQHEFTTLNLKTQKKKVSSIYYMIHKEKESQRTLASKLSVNVRKKRTLSRSEFHAFSYRNSLAESTSPQSPTNASLSQTYNVNLRLEYLQSSIDLHLIYLGYDMSTPIARTLQFAEGLIEILDENATTDINPRVFYFNFKVQMSFIINTCMVR